MENLQELILSFEFFADKMSFYLVVFFLNDAGKKPLAILPNTSITDGTMRSKNVDYYLGKKMEFNWGNKAATRKSKVRYFARILFARKS